MNRCIVYRSDHFYSLVVEADFYVDASFFFFFFFFFLLLLLFLQEIKQRILP